MLCDTVDIDDELFAAQDEHRLVVFAGAGVSLSSPSSLPTFKGLVKEIGGGRLPQDPRIPMDVALGEMSDTGLNVHSRCRDIIANAASRPNSYHNSLLGLFKDPRDIRIVTTNFDLHFTSQADKLGLNPKRYFAPALPIGGDFSGIVHLHGSIIEPDRMVLTDADLGAAYLSDGWATRFLQGMFNAYTVLFVGYSHSDPPITYLNLGLGSRRKRHFVLTSADSPQWKRLKLTTQLYKTGRGITGHSRLARALAAWAENTKIRPTEVARRLQQILANPAIRGESVEGFVLRHYKRPDSVGAFIDNATLFEWVEWLHGKGLVKQLLGEIKGEDHPTMRLAVWVGGMLARDKTGKGLAIFEACGETIGFNAARGILLVLLKSAEAGPLDLSSRAWLSVLLRQSATTYLLLYSTLANNLVRHGQWDLVLTVIEFLTRPVIRFPGHAGRSYRFGEEKPCPVLVGEHYDLSQACQIASGAAGSDPEKQNELLAVLEANSIELENQCKILGFPTGPHASNIVSVSPIYRESRYDSDAIGVLVKYTAEVARRLADAGALSEKRLKQWLSSDHPILIRSALHCLNATTYAAGDALGLLLEHNSIYPMAYGALEELEPLIYQIYPKLTEEEKAQLWSAVEAGPSDMWKLGMTPERENAHRDYMIERLIAMFPEDVQAKEARVRLRQRDPEAAEQIGPYSPRRGLDAPIREIHDKSPISADEIERKEPSVFLDEFLEFKETNWLAPNRDGLLNAICLVAERNPAWAVDLLRTLAERGALDNDISTRLLWKLKWPALTRVQTDWLLGALDPGRQYHPDFLRVYSQFIFGPDFSGAEDDADAGQLGELLQVSLILWELAKDLPDAETAGFAERDWVFSAINSVPGRICEFWLQLTQYRQRKSPELERAWPAEIATVMDGVPGAISHAARMALSILAHHLAAVRFLAPVWTVQKLYPCFDFNQVGDTAFITWNAFAGYGRLSRELAVELPPYFKIAFDRLPEMKDSLGERFVDLVAAISVSGVWDVNTDRWLDVFYRHLNLKQRKKWLFDLARLLKGSLSSDQVQVWKAWLRDWWKGRTDGFPNRIDVEEVDGFYHLSLALGPVAHESLPYLRAGPDPHFGFSHVFIEIADSKLYTEDPHALVSIVLWLLPHVNYLASGGKDIDTFLEKLPPLASLREDLGHICDQLVRLSSAPPDLLERIDAKFVQPDSPIPPVLPGAE